VADSVGPRLAASSGVYGRVRMGSYASATVADGGGPSRCSACECKCQPSISAPFQRSHWPWTRANWGAIRPHPPASP
jgi:hypothetical protein